MALRAYFIAALTAWALGASAHPSQSPQTRDLISTILGNLESDPLYGAPANDFTCTSSRNPVVVIHGLGSSADTDLNVFQSELNSRGYCTFSMTYGAYPIPSFVGGLRSMEDTAQDLAAFIQKVQNETGAEKVDLVGHSEGGVQALYIPLTQPGLAEILEHVVALGPSIHGAPYFGISDLAYVGGNVTRELVGELITDLGCPACEQLAPDGAVTDAFTAAAGRVAQPGNKITIISSESDSLVPPPITAVDEPGVDNVSLQTTCPDDTAGHAALAYDHSVWNLILRALEESDEEFFACQVWPPI